MPVEEPSDEIVATYLRERVRKLFTLRDADGGETWNQNRLADEIDVHRGSMSRFLSGHTFGSTKIKRGLMRVLELNYDQLHKDALALVRHRPELLRKPAAEPHLEREDRYPNRSDAARFARANKVSEEAITRVLRLALKSSEDPSPEWWYERMKAENDKIRFGIEEIGVPLSRADEENMRPGAHRVDPKHLRPKK